MEFPQEIIELIEQYVNGQLKAESLERFEKLIEEDIVLASEVEFQKEMQAFLTDSPENELRKNLQMLSDQVVEPKKDDEKAWFWWLFPAEGTTNVLDWLLGHPARHLVWLAPLLLVAGWWLRPSDTALPVPVPYIAVLPFSDAQKEQAYFGDGFAEEILLTLSKLQDLKVAGQTASFSFKNTTSTIVEIGDQLEVTHVLKGSVSRQDKTIQVTAQLVNVENGYQVWSDEYEEALVDVFDIQNELLQNVVQSLFDKLSPAQKAKIISPTPPTGEVYDLFLRAKHIHKNLYKSSYSPTDFLDSEKLFFQAIELNPNYALAHAGLADLYDSYWVQNEPKEEDADREKYKQRMMQAAKTALQLAPENAYVNQVNGYVQHHLNDPTAAYQYFLKSYEISPNNPESSMGLSNLYLGLGLHEDALLFAEQAMAIDPLFRSAWAMQIYANFYLSRWEKTVDICESFLEIDPNDQTALEYLFRAYFLLNQKEKALNVLPKITNVETLGLDLEIALLQADSSYIQNSLMEHNPNLAFAVYTYQGAKDKAAIAYQQATNDYLKDASSKSVKEGSYYLDHINNPRLTEFQTQDWFQAMLAFEKRQYDFLAESYPRASEILER